MNAKGDTFDATNESYETVDCVPIEPGDPLQYQILEMTVFMSVKRITHLYFGYRGVFSDGVWSKQQRRQVKETYWMASPENLKKNSNKAKRENSGHSNSENGTTGPVVESEKEDEMQLPSTGLSQKRRP